MNDLENIYTSHIYNPASLIICISTYLHDQYNHIYISYPYVSIVNITWYWLYN